MKSLVIAEKPSVARDIARVLHCTQKGNGILEGKEYVVTWALGHLVTLADPEEYDKKYMKWDMETLPMMPDKMKLVVIRQTSKQYTYVSASEYHRFLAHQQAFDVRKSLCHPCRPYSDRPHSAYAYRSSSSFSAPHG